MSVGPDDPAGRSAQGRNSEGRPYSPAETSRGAFQEPTLIRHGFAVPPSPLEGEGYLYRERWLRKLRRETESPSHRLTAATAPFHKGAGKGTPQGGLSRPSADSPSASPLRGYRAVLFPSQLIPDRSAGGHMGPPLRRKLDRERWLKKLRRKSGTAPKADFANPGPSGPGETAPKHS